MKKVFIVGGAFHYAAIIEKAKLVHNIEEAELAIFTGGADVDPELYGENKGSFTGINTIRDKEEIGVFKQAQKLKIPCLGICRGLN